MKVLNRLCCSLALLWTGCSHSPSETLTLRLSDQSRTIHLLNHDLRNSTEVSLVQQGAGANVGLTLTPVPEDVTNVKAELLDIRRALVENESISSENSVAKFQIQSTEVPKKMHASRIVLKYNGALLKVQLEVGRLYTFRFQDDGSFFDIAEIELPY